MKVAELKIGMLVEPVGDSEIFCLQSGYKCALPHIRVLNKNWSVSRNSQPLNGLKAMYLGDRKEASVSKKDHPWSNRFVLIAGQIAAVDPAAWKRIKVVKNNDS